MIGRRDVSAWGPGAVGVGGDVHGDVTTYTYEFASHAVPIPVACQDLGPLFADVGVARPEFVSRRWLSLQVDSFLAEHNCGYVWIEAEAGLGKTAFAAHLVHRRKYVSHFTRLPNATTTTVALRNLSAQLIARYGLDELAPNGLVPDWAQQPEGFAAILARAADRARAAKEQVVIVVDGLDEAETVDHGPPLGLPSLLPTGAFLICTYRTGFGPAHSDSPSTVIRLRPEDSSNREDLARYLSTVLEGEGIRQRLAPHGVSADELARVLVDRCGGVWMYLRYVLADIQLGRYVLDDLDTLPSGLVGYYARRIQTWRERADWAGVVEPSLMTLAAAGEPLSAAVLAELSGLPDVERVRRLCDVDFRPYLTVAGDPRRYGIYHASMREFLHGGFLVHDERAMQSDRMQALTQNLAAAAKKAHERIADHYTSAFGGFTAGLPALAADPTLGVIHGGYPLRHLTRHGEQGHGDAWVRKLLLTQASTRSCRVENVWHAAQAGAIDSYLADLERARRASQLTDDRAVAAAQPAQALGDEILYVLMAASTRSRTDGLGLILLTALAETGTWPMARAAAEARRLTEPGMRCEALARLARAAASGKLRDGLCAEAIAAASSHRDDQVIVNVLAILAPIVPRSLTAEAVASAEMVRAPNDRVRTLAELSAHRAPSERDRMLDAAFAVVAGLDHDRQRADALADLAAFLPRSMQTELLEILARLVERHAATPDDDPAERWIADECFRTVAKGIERVAPHLPPDLLGAVLPIARALTRDSARLQALVSVVRALEGSRRHDVVQEVLRDLSRLDRADARAVWVAEVAPYLDEDERDLVVDKALQELAEIGREELLVGPLQALAAHLPPERRTAPLRDALNAAIGDELNQFHLLGHLAPDLPEDLLAEAAAHAHGVEDPSARSEKLAILAHHLPAQAAELLADALDAVSTTGDDKSFSAALMGLTPYLPAGSFATVLDVAQTLNETDRASVLRGMAQHLPGHLVTRATVMAWEIKEKNSRFDALAGLAPRLSADALELVHGGVGALRDTWFKVRTLTDLTPYLPARRRSESLVAALGAARRIRPIPDLIDSLLYIAPDLPPELAHETYDIASTIKRAPDRAFALAALLPFLPEDRIPDAIKSARALADSSTLNRALVDLVARVDGQDRKAMLDEAFAAAMGTDDSDLIRVNALLDLAPMLPPERLSEVLDAVTGLADAYTTRPYAEALRALGPCLPLPLHAKALSYACSITSVADRVTAVAAYLPKLSDQARSSLVREMLAALHEAPGGPHYDDAVAALAPHLSADQLVEAASMASAGGANAISALVNRALVVMGQGERSRLLALIRHAFKPTTRDNCFLTIRAVAPAIHACGGSDAIAACLIAITNVRKWWP